MHALKSVQELYYYWSVLKAHRRLCKRMKWSLLNQLKISLMLCSDCVHSVPTLRCLLFPLPTDATLWSNCPTIVNKGAHSTCSSVWNFHFLALSLSLFPSFRLPLSPINVLRVSVFFVPSFSAAADASAAFAWSVQNRLKLMMSLDRANEFFIFHFSHAIQWDEWERERHQKKRIEGGEEENEGEAAPRSCCLTNSSCCLCFSACPVPAG